MKIERINKRGNTTISEGDGTVHGVLYRDGLAHVRLEVPAAGSRGAYVVEIGVHELAEYITHAPVGRLDVVSHVFLDHWGAISHQLAQDGLDNIPLAAAGRERPTVLSPDRSDELPAETGDENDFAGGAAGADIDTFPLPLEEPEEDGQPT